MDKITPEATINYEAEALRLAAMLGKYELFAHYQTTWILDGASSLSADEYYKDALKSLQAKIQYNNRYFDIGLYRFDIESDTFIEQESSLRWRAEILSDKTAIAAVILHGGMGIVMIDQVGYHVFSFKAAGIETNLASQYHSLAYLSHISSEWPERPVAPTPDNDNVYVIKSLSELWRHNIAYAGIHNAGAVLMERADKIGFPLLFVEHGDSNDGYTLIPYKE